MQRKRPDYMNNILDDIFHRDDPICQIIQTTPHKQKSRFVDYRPRPNTCLDYNISQTDAKLDAGATKIHIQQTLAEYVPKPLPRKSSFQRTKFFDGGRPRWKFVDELWRAKQEKSQQRYQAEFLARKTARRRGEHSHMLSAHRRALAFAGPAWFQELSPGQVATVDQLQCCVLKDLSERGIGHTQTNIAALGLVLRPHHRKIELALANCCGSAVEFLLVLYQLLAPSREQYSINDRLLLSAVVHLTMTDTLRELHVRIPSPPRPPKQKPEPPCKAVRKTYPSPYLEPYSYVRPAPKFSGVYTNKHVQRPDSRYFSYLASFRKLQTMASELQDCELSAEAAQAQVLYQELGDFQVPYLLPPSKYQPCQLAKRFKRRLDEVELNCTDFEGSLKAAAGGARKMKTFLIVGMRQEGCQMVPVIGGVVEYTIPRLKQKTMIITGLKQQGSQAIPIIGGVVEVELPEPPVASKCAPRRKVPIVTGLKREGCQLVPIHGGLTDAKYCACKEAYGEKVRLLKEERARAKEVFGHLVVKNLCSTTKPRKKPKCRCKKTDIGPSNSCKCKTCKKPRTYLISGVQKRGSQSYPIIGGIVGNKTQSTQIPKKKAAKKKKSEEKRCGIIQRIFIINGVRVEGSTVIPIVGGVIERRVCPCDAAAPTPEIVATADGGKARKGCPCKEKSKQQLERDFCQCEKCKNTRKRFIITGLSEQGPETVPIIGGICPAEPPCSCLEDYEQKAKQLEYEREGIVPFKPPQHAEPPPEKKPRNSCKEQSQNEIQREFCNCPKCQEARTTYIIAGVKPQGCGAVKIIGGVAERKTCSCLAAYEEKIRQFEAEKERRLTSPCECRAQAKDQLMKPFCMCVKCEQARKLPPSYVIGGLVATTTGELVPIIGGVSADRPCSCLANYERVVTAFENYEKRKELITKMLQEQQRYIIGGVARTSSGPVYILSGVKEKPKCVCATWGSDLDAERRLEAEKPKAPGGRIKYNIGGVTDTPQGRVYILNSAIPMPDCACMELYTQFEEQHRGCLRLFEQYTKQMEHEINLYKEEFYPDAVDEPLEEPSRLIDMLIDPAFIKPKTESESSSSGSELCVCKDEDSEIKLPPFEECVDCSCVPKLESIGALRGGCEKTSPKTAPRRFFIFPKIKTSPKWQLKILKQALESLAFDEFPLAKLPECYKLPHFKLWMQMRCGKVWTQDDRYSSVLASRGLWRHTDQCSVRSQMVPKLPITLEAGKRLNWCQAPYVKLLLEELWAKYYRAIKRNNINFNREFFPTTFSYEFPFSSWRDCFFAYSASKEEEILARFMWQKHHYKAYSEMKRQCR